MAVYVVASKNSVLRSLDGVLSLKRKKISLRFVHKAGYIYFLIRDSLRLLQIEDMPVVKLKIESS